MKIEVQRLEQKAESTLKQCLNKIPFVQISDIRKEPTAVGARTDFTVELTVYGMKQVLAVEVKRTGQPKAAREAINSLLRWISLNTGVIWHKKCYIRSTPDFFELKKF